VLGRAAALTVGLGCRRLLRLGRDFHFLRQGALDGLVGERFLALSRVSIK
jgi:hypothetical protein